MLDTIGAMTHMIHRGFLADKSDEELKHSIRENIGKNNKINSDSIEVTVNNATAILNGSVKTYEERRLAGQEAWNTAGVVKVPKRSSSI